MESIIRRQSNSTVKSCIKVHVHYSKCKNNTDLSYPDTRASSVCRINPPSYRIYWHLIWLSCSFCHSYRYVNSPSCTSHCRSLASPSRPLRRHSNVRMWSDEMALSTPRKVYGLRNRS